MKQLLLAITMILGFILPVSFLTAETTTSSGSSDVYYYDGNGPEDIDPDRYEKIEFTDEDSAQGTIHLVQNGGGGKGDGRNGGWGHLGGWGKYNKTPGFRQRCKPLAIKWNCRGNMYFDSTTLECKCMIPGRGETSP